MKKIEIEICNYPPIKSIRCLVCKKLIKHIPHSKQRPEKRQKTCRSKECLEKYPEIHRNLKGIKNKKNKQQREKYKNDSRVRERIKNYNQRSDIKEKRMIWNRNYMRRKLGITEERWRK